MAHSIPKRFRRELPEKKFRKRILHRVHLPEERAFLDSVFEATSAGTRRLPETISEEDAKHLTRLARDIKANRGSLRRVRLAALGLVALGAVLFNVLFLDELLERSAERGLEAVFRARSDVSGLDLGLFRGFLEIDHVSVGDRNRPMRNLFELEGLRGEVSVPELLKRNLVIREASVETVRTGTERETSAELPGDPSSPPDSAPDGPTEAAGERVQTAARDTLSGLGSFGDPDAFISRELAELETFARIDELESELEGFSDRWSERTTALEADARQVLERTDRVRNIDPDALDGPQEIAEAIARVREAREGVDGLLETAREAVAAAEQEYRQAEAEAAALRGGLSKDFDYITERLTVDSADVSALVADLGQEFLERLLGDIYYAALRSIEVAERLSELRGGDEAGEAEGIARAPGRTVTFPGVHYPRFFLERAAVGIVPGERDLRLDGELTGISSNPALVDTPSRLSVSGDSGGVSLGGSAELSYGGDGDGKGHNDEDGSGPDELLTRVTGAGLPFRSPEIPELGTFRSDYRFDATLRLTRGGRAVSTTHVELSDLNFGQVSTDNPALQGLQSALAELDSLTADARMSISQGGFELEELSTDAEEALRTGVARELEERRDEYLARARRELEEQVNERLAGLDPELESAREIRGELEDVRGLLEDRREVVARKRRELEQRSRRLAEDERRRLEEKTRDRLEDATRDLDMNGFGF
ncbi:MAG: hypothetical protein ACOCXE_03405 [Spirochaetota bacterium]